MNFLYSLTLKSIGLLCTLIGSFTHVWMGNIMHWSLEKAGLLSYTDIPDFHTFHYTIFFKNHIH